MSKSPLGYELDRLTETSYRLLRKLIVTLTGTFTLFIGLLMIVLPGPAFLVIPLGLLILGTEFVWARLFLKKLKEKIGL